MTAAQHNRKQVLSKAVTIWKEKLAKRRARVAIERHADAQYARVLAGQALRGWKRVFAVRRVQLHKQVTRENFFAYYAHTAGVDQVAALRQWSLYQSKRAWRAWMEYHK